LKHPLGGACLTSVVAVAALVIADTGHAQGLFGSVFGAPPGGYGNYRTYGSPGPAAYPARPAAADPYYFKPKRKKPAVAAPPKKDATVAVKPPPGPLLIAISLNKQRLTLYSNGSAIAHSPVSTGTATHPTPTGIFSVIGKEKFHRSNLYSNAPMPFMQRITWSGVALHQGVLPGYPASHGCIRLPMSFAQYLWGTTRMGARVIITRDELAPFDIAHARLFVPRPADDVPTDQVQASGGLKVAESDDAGKSSDAARPVLVGAVIRTAAMESNTATGVASDSSNKPGRASALELKDKPRMSDPVSVFISRKTGKLYVRQGFEPLFDAPVTIRDPEQPIGTHIYTAMDFNENRTAMRWVALSLSSQSAAEPERHVIVGGKKKKVAEPVHAPPASGAARAAAAAALDRIDIPKETVERISDLLSPASSLIISDLPMSHETGKYTDFVILTQR
jgi:lipoprotein-anchoring transpeptidase ErfK/SrfK